ncbi:MAG TPA: DUF3105 domain-containing protein [Nocardioidaceae bacterium]|nr:DUF3105 domain-containing protein [Nocardioidaceae bacterium]
MGNGKSKGSDRRDRLARLERERKAAERKRTLLFAGIIGVIAAVIIGATGWSLWQESEQNAAIADRNLDEFGVPAAEASCSEPQETEASGNNEHIAEGDIDYGQAPPASGPHRPSWVQLAREFYTAEDRPELEMLVHNLEHGYTILWYDETFAKDEQAVDELKGLAQKFSGDASLDTAFIAAPWTSEDVEDEGKFPQGKHVALTRWYADPETREDQKGITQYCGQLSGEVVEQFMEDYPQEAAPEGGVVGNL